MNPILTSKQELLNNFERLSNNSPLAIIYLDHEMTVKHWNSTAEELFGWKESEVVGWPLPIIPAFELRKLKKMFTSIKNGGSFTTFEARKIKKNGKLIDTIINPLPWFDVTGKIKGLIAIIQDVTGLKLIENELLNKQKKLDQIVYFDYLTGLPNRVLFEEKLKQLVKEAKQTQSNLALIFLDLDGFKLINDTLGHKIGDKLLKKVALRLDQMRKREVLVSRFGGDEFTVVIPNFEDLEEIHNIANQYLNLFNWPFVIDEYELFITTSIGISIYPIESKNVHDLVKDADLAMNQAKEDGKNKYELFSKSMINSSIKKFFLQNDLRKAIQENQIHLAYQPRVDSKTNKIVAVEALARWTHPKWGNISPIDFISLAEELGLINIIGEQLLFVACSQNKEWQDNGYSPIKISVNFSALQFLQANIVDTVENILYSTGLHPKWLEIEITESAVLKNELNILLKLERLREMGISIAIDDFGTGYSSLSYIKKIKPNTVKIDKSFIQQIPDEQESTEIVKAIIKLFNKLKINVVAEGVEKSEQYNYLRNINCNELQGYLYSKPVSNREFSNLLIKNQSNFY